MSRKRNAIARVMSATCAVAVAFSSCENKKSIPTEVARESTTVRESTTETTTTTIATQVKKAVTTTATTTKTAQKPITTTTTATAYVVSIETMALTETEPIVIAETTSVAPVQEVQQTTVSVTEVVPVIQTEPVAVNISSPEDAVPMSFSDVKVSYDSMWVAPSYYSVELGDCLSTIATKFSCTEDEVRDTNPQVTDWNWIMPGDSIAIPKNDAVATYYSSSYTVESGDCLTIIAQNLNCSTDDLIKANPNVNWDFIQPGDSIVNPTSFEVVDNQTQIQENVPNWAESVTPEIAETTPIAQVEVETTVVETMPAEPAPAETAPVETIPVETEPVTETTIVETTTVSETANAEHTTTKKTVKKTVASVPTAIAVRSSYFERIKVEDNSVNEVQEDDDCSTEGNTSTEGSISTEDHTSTEGDTSTEDTTSTEDCTSNESVIPESSNLPEEIMAEVKRQMLKYPGMEMAVGIYSLRGGNSYTFNEFQEMAAGCTVKAGYALYVLKTCEEKNIDIWTYELTYKEGMKNEGSGDIKDNYSYGDTLTIDYLLERLLRISDNTAYNILCSEFGLDEYQEFLNSIGGQNLYGVQYGIASVNQRKNEWMEIYRYVNSDAQYAQTLKSFITNSPYCYICDGMADWHEYMHKSGWSDGNMDYTCAADAAIVDDMYLIVVITQDYTTGVAHTDVVRSIGYAAEQYTYLHAGMF